MVVVTNKFQFLLLRHDLVLEVFGVTGMNSSLGQIRAAKVVKEHRPGSAASTKAIWVL